MAFDGIVTKSVVEELNKTLVGGRIDKIYQQEKDEILIHIHNLGRTYRLLISSSSNNPRIYMTNITKSNPPSPPMFCMLLRKHLSGGIILNIEQYLLDRIVFIDISSLDELGQPSEKRLIVEIMGKHSNIILVEKNSLNILDSIKRIPISISRIRQILPGLPYEFPPMGQKKNPLTTTQEEFLDLLNINPKTTQIYRFLYTNYMGLSPLISKEICFRTGLDIDRTIGSLDDLNKIHLYESFEDIIAKTKINNFTPLYITTETQNNILAFHALELHHLGEDNKFFLSSISELLDNYYSTKDNLDRISQKSQSIRRSIQVKLDRAINKLAKQKEELLESQDREKYKIYGDLISANLYKIGRGIDSIYLENFYDEDLKEILVPLDITLSPPNNAQRYYRKYSKLKTAQQLLLRQIPETQEEINYLENVLLSIDNSTVPQELDEIKEELIIEGYLKSPSKRKKTKTSQVSSPHQYISSDGFNIYVGKNNRQNDYLTLRFAHKDDLWLHVQNMPGSHVIIQSSGQEIPDTTLEEAAILAAYYSKGKHSNNVPVDYTEKKHVRKPRHAKTGMVIYDNHKTILVSPTIDIINKIIKVEN